MAVAYHGEVIVGERGDVGAYGPRSEWVEGDFKVLSLAALTNSNMRRR